VARWTSLTNSSTEGRWTELIWWVASSTTSGGAGVGGGALGGGGQLALLAPAGDHQVTEVEVEQPVSHDGDLVGGGLTPGL
jgi:hypothetical protein